MAGRAKCHHIVSLAGYIPTDPNLSWESDFECTSSELLAAAHLLVAIVSEIVARDCAGEVRVPIVKSFCQRLLEPPGGHLQCIDLRLASCELDLSIYLKYINLHY
jgi:hypothetical protein